MTKDGLFFWISLIIGLVVAFFIPLNAGDSLAMVSGFLLYFINLATWIVVPLFFFQVLVNIYNLRFASLRFYLMQTIVVLLIAPFIASCIAVLVIELSNPIRLPPVYVSGTIVPTASFSDIFTILIPSSFSSLFSGSLQFLPGIFLGAVLFGSVMYSLRGAVRSVIELSISIYRLIVRVNQIIVRILSLFMFLPAIAFILYLRGLDNFKAFSNILLILALGSAGLAFLVFPAMILLRRGGSGVFSYYRLLLSPWVLGFIGGNRLVAYSQLFKHCQTERLSFAGQKVNLALFTLFFNPGSVFVLLSIFLVLVRSHTSLEISLGDLLNSVLIGSFISFFASFFNGPGLLLGLTVLSGLYGKGLGESYLIVQGVIPLASGLGIALDIAATAFLLEFFDFHKIGVPDEQDREGQNLLGEFYLQ
jgi:hypothetical protein